MLSLFNKIEVNWYSYPKRDFKIKWGLGIGDWGLGIGDWAQSPIPNPHKYK